MSNDEGQWGQECDFPAPESVLLVLDLDPARALTVTVRWQP